ncbi:MAG: hypothetical protein JW725_04830 [Candidatus Babeliaceae bacterium]|nr:hypothetical protein [Candidatus Babeliaceae bacterium]
MNGIDLQGKNKFLGAMLSILGLLLLFYLLDIIKYGITVILICAALALIWQGLSMLGVIDRIQHIWAKKKK